MWEEFRNKTNHLSEKQKENLYKEFYEEEINVSKLMDKYNITNIETIDFYKCLPLRETLVKCKYCESNLYELPNLGILLYEVSKYICLECNHIEYNYHSKKCDCDNCLKEREKVKKEKIEREKRTEIEKNYKRDRWVYPEMISIEDALLLSSFLLIFMGEDLQDTIPYDDVKVKITPNKHWDIKIIEKLFNNRYLVVSPNSKIEAFTIENFPSIFYYSRVKYYFAIKNQDQDNVQFYMTEGLEDTIKHIRNYNPKNPKNRKKIDYNELDDEDKKNREIIIDENVNDIYLLWKKMVVEECVEYLLYQLGEVGWDYKPGEKSYNIIGNLVTKLSESEIFTIIYDAVTLTCRMEKENKIIGKSACITTVENIVKISEKVFLGEWRRVKGERPGTIKQSHLSRNLHYNVLKLGEEGFNVIPSKELIKEKILNEENEVDFPQ